MNAQRSKQQAMPMFLKGLCLLVVGMFVFLGIVGLILPIIPGILFLFLAALLLAKVSTRFDAALIRNRQMRYWRRRWDTTNRLPLLQRIKLSFWVAAKAAVNGVESAVNSINKMRGDN